MEELIWKYIDGQASEDETQQVTVLLQSDVNAQKLFNQLTNIDKSLSQAMQHTSTTFTATLLKRMRKLPQMERASFKPILYIFLLLIVLSIVIASIPSVNTNTSSGIDWSFLHFELDLSPKYLIFALSALSAIAIVWLDLLMQKKRSI